MKYPIILLLIATLFGCKTLNNSVSKNHSDNNIVVKTNKGVNQNTGNTEIIFEGKDNIFEIIKKNTAFFNGSRDVIIIKGNGNIIKLYNRNIVDLSSFSTDTLVFLGDNEKYVMLVENEVVFKNKQRLQIDTVQMKTPEFNSTKYVDEFSESDECWYTIKRLEDEIIKGDTIAYFELAEMYNYGLEGVTTSAIKAIDLYEYGAAKNEIQSIRRLGDIWFIGNFDMKANKTKGVYYYKRGASLGDLYCKEVLAEM